MNKLLIAVLCTFALVGCSRTQNTTSRYELPDELSDCSVYYVKENVVNGMTVVRCPNSTTTTVYKQGEETRSVTTVE